MDPVEPGGAWCSRCGVVDDRILYARRAAGVWLCLQCWRASARPWPRLEALSAVELENIAAATRRRMHARGGADRHLTRKGIA